MAIEARAKSRRVRSPRPEKARGEVCLNCETQVNTRYCPHCGQENVHGDHSVSMLARDFLTEIAYYDSKLWLTFRTMFAHPGRLSAEWAQGRRMKYVSPIKLYLWITFVFFFAMALRPSPTSTATHPPVVDAKMSADLNQLESRHAWVGDLMERLNSAVTTDRKAFTQTLRDQFPKVLFVLLPVLALILKLLFWRQRKYYVDNLVFVLHLHSCYFAVLLLAVLLPPAAATISPVLPTLAAIVVVLLVIWMVAYTFVALMRFYGQPWWITALKSLVLGGVYSTLLLIGLMTAAFIALYNLPSRTSAVTRVPTSPSVAAPR